MTLKMFQVQICLVAVRTLVFALGVLGRVGGSLSGGGRGSTRMRGQDAAPSLLSNDVKWLRLLVRENRRMRV